MRFSLPFLLILAAVPGANPLAQTSHPRALPRQSSVQPDSIQSDNPYAFGADVSFLPQAEQSGMVFKDDGIAKSGLQILHDHGYNWIRMRVFVDPASARTNLPNDLAY